MGQNGNCFCTPWRKTYGEGAVFCCVAAAARARASTSVALAFTFVCDPWSSISTEPSRLTLRRLTGRPGGSCILPTFTPFRITGKRTEATRRTCLGQSCGCLAMSAISSGGAGVAEGSGAEGEGWAAGVAAAVSAGDFSGRGPVSSASEGRAGEEAGVVTATLGDGVGAGDSTAGVGGVWATAGLLSAGVDAAREPCVGLASALWEEGENVVLASQVDSGTRLDHPQSPALIRTHKNAIQIARLCKNLRMVLISRPKPPMRKRNSFCSFPPGS